MPPYSRFADGPDRPRSAIAPREISWSPDGSRIAFTKIGPEPEIFAGESLGIYEVNADGSGLRERDSHYPKWRYSLFSQATSIDPSSWGRIKKDHR